MSWNIRRIAVANTGLAAAWSVSGIAVQVSGSSWNVLGLSASLPGPNNSWLVTGVKASTGQDVVVSGPLAVDAFSTVAISAISATVGLWTQVSGPAVELETLGNNVRIAFPGTLSGGTVIVRFATVGFDGISVVKDLSIILYPCAERAVRGGVQVPVKISSLFGELN